MGLTYWIRIKGTQTWKAVSSREYHILKGKLSSNRMFSGEDMGFSDDLIQGVVTSGEHPDELNEHIRARGYERGGFDKAISAVVKYLQENPMLVSLGERLNNITLSVTMTDQIEAIRKLEYEG